jgi:hypothetical protein
MNIPLPNNSLEYAIYSVVVVYISVQGLKLKFQAGSFGLNKDNREDIYKIKERLVSLETKDKSGTKEHDEIFNRLRTIEELLNRLIGKLN